MTEAVLQPGAPPAPPANAAEARTQLDALLGSKEEGAKLLAGDAEVNRRYRDLRAMADNPDPADAVTAALTGNLGSIPDSSVKMMADTAGMLREIGISEPVIEQTLRGHEVSALEMKQVEAWRARAMSDQTFVKLWLSGDMEARRKMALSQIIVSGAVKDARGSF
jgi:hypothetical protein